MTARPALFNIPSGVPFARALADGLLREAGDDRLGLSRMRILLPTRRACRTVRDAFLQQSDGRPTLLPAMQPLGDVEEEELSLHLSGSKLAPELIALPPAMPPLRRRILLARAIEERDGAARGPEHALILSQALGRLMDQIHTEGLDLAALPGLVTEDFAQHWQITTDFLKILSEAWPLILAQHGAIDAADRRNRLLRLLAEHWEAEPPSGPIIAAGSTGSIPAAARLLSVIAHMPTGRVILPGLDQAMDPKSWDEIEDTHPQATLKTLLQHIGATRGDVRLWPAPQHNHEDRAARRLLATEIMRPAQTTECWNDLAQQKNTLNQGLQHLERIDCDTPEEEAQTIALIFRRTLEQPGPTAALVTPDRALARRVASCCRRWGLEVDDSAGRPLHETGPGIYMRLVLQAAIHYAAPASLLALLRHNLCSVGMGHAALETQAGFLEKTLLRGPKPPPGFDGLRLRADSMIAEHPGSTRRVEIALALAGRLEPIFAPLMRLCDGERHPSNLWLEQHLRAGEALAATPESPGADRLWQGEAGEDAARFFAGMMEESAALPPLDGQGYLDVVTMLMGGCAVRPRYGTHPRLAILGQLEARLLQADTVVLGSLNERTWPPDPGYDPWMSRPMRKQFGLPPPERDIGLAGHDFVQGFCAPHVVMTRALRQDNAPTVPARWLQRLDAVMQAANIALNAPDTPWRALAQQMDHDAAPQPCKRPEPRPPVDKRPRELPVTAIETWLRDPYAIYAKYVLRLRRLDPLEKPPDASARGTFLHDVLSRFITAFPGKLPDNARQVLIDMGMDHLKTLGDNSGFWRWWIPRFERIASWLVQHEAEWRQAAQFFAAEAVGRIALPGPAGPFTLTARADRIDRLKAGGMAIIDYKSGGSWSPKAMKEGRLPQLPLEAIILDQGGFPGTGGLQTEALAYWKLTGGIEEGKPAMIEGEDVRAAAAMAAEGLLALIEAYDRPETPYLSLPDSHRVPAFQDYAHLARVQEWSVADEGEDAA